MASIAAIRRHPAVQIVDDERAIGNGVIVTLRKGWSWDPAQDNRVLGEDGVHAMQNAVKHERYRFNGPYDL